MRIRMPEGHFELSLEGVNYNCEQDGTFVVPDHLVPQLTANYGATPELSLSDLEARAVQADSVAASAKSNYERLAAAAKATRATYEQAKIAARANIEKRARAELAAVN